MSKAKKNSGNGKNEGKAKKMSCLDAAYRILAQCHGKLNPKQLAAKMIGKGLWQTSGLTPHQTIAANINCDLKKNGENSRFKKVGPALFAANATAKK